MCFRVFLGVIMLIKILPKSNSELRRRVGALIVPKYKKFSFVNFLTREISSTLSVIVILALRFS